ncbi:hypothetical protein PGT21_002143 [Puccinia graminis f. sp. tritici]|uniref:Uncharacterized protein n=1 Tax=Puccinia graminis f. sp. tritici TaxID=56615 RepID=A0A5B0PW50_PUCGR|nr:hypothetical protein PGT21_002143 [Puccinia graminis f. sp. tritici]KAA1105114.1 hypothetical protein PGTUg99_012541 [Puccinia graminis f. sp. tritici]
MSAPGRSARTSPGHPSNVSRVHPKLIPRASSPRCDSRYAAPAQTTAADLNRWRPVWTPSGHVVPATRLTYRRRPTQSRCENGPPCLHKPPEAFSVRSTDTHGAHGDITTELIAFTSVMEC